MSDDSTLHALWVFGQAIIERVDPIVRSALAGTTSAECTRCPICVINAAVGDRSDDLTTMLMAQGWEALGALQRFFDEHDPKVHEDSAAAASAAAAKPAGRSTSRYQPITIVRKAS